MTTIIERDAKETGIKAGKKAAYFIRNAIKKKGSAHIILATGSSQFETLNQLINEEGIEWQKVTMYHLDEYVNLPISHPASFRNYLHQRFLSKVPKLKEVNLVNGETNPAEECERLESLIKNVTIDVALIGIGENGHLAFNDPPADLDTDRSYLIVTLDELCQKQQVNEGWFNSIHEVPKQAISMSVKQIMLSEHIVCTVPDKRKANAVKNTLEENISAFYPSTILRNHPECYLFLDEASASELQKKIN